MKKKTMFLALVIMLSSIFSNAGSFADENRSLEIVDFGYGDYEMCENLPDFEKKIELPGVDRQTYYGPTGWFPAPSDEDDMDNYGDSLVASYYRNKYWERFVQAANSAPIVLVVAPDTDQQIQFVKTTGDTDGFTLTSASIKKVLRNDTTVNVTAGNEVWLREAYWVTGQWTHYQDYANELCALLGSAAEPLIDKALLEENGELYCGSFLSEHGNLESPLYEGDTLVFADIDHDASNATVFVVNDLFKFKTDDPIKYSVVRYKYQQMIGELIGDEALNMFGLDSNPNFVYESSDHLVNGADYSFNVSDQIPTTEPEPDPTKTSCLFPVLLGFGAGVLVCIVPTAIVLIVRRKKSRAASAVSVPSDRG